MIKTHVTFASLLLSLPVAAQIEHAVAATNTPSAVLDDANGRLVQSLPTGSISVSSTASLFVPDPNALFFLGAGASASVSPPVVLIPGLLEFNSVTVAASGHTYATLPYSSAHTSDAVTGDPGPQHYTIDLSADDTTEADIAMTVMAAVIGNASARIRVTGPGFTEDWTARSAFTATTESRLRRVTIPAGGVVSLQVEIEGMATNSSPLPLNDSFSAQLSVTARPAGSVPFLPPVTPGDSEARGDSADAGKPTAPRPFTRGDVLRADVKSGSPLE